MTPTTPTPPPHLIGGWLAILVGLLVGPFAARRLEGIPPLRAFVVLVALFVATVVGGRLHFVLNQPQIYEGRWGAVFTYAGGFHAGGAIIALALAFWPLARWVGVDVGRLADGLAPTIGVGIALARIDCWFRGCCYGFPADWWWCLRVPPGSPAYRWQVVREVIPPDAPTSLPAHPLALYFVGGGLLVAAAALSARRRKRYDGQVALVALTVFGATSFGIEFFRADFTSRTYWGPLPQLTWTALAIALAGCAALGTAGRRPRRVGAVDAVAVAR